MKIAVSGKGGVGKTLIAAGLAWQSAEWGEKTIAIDADPSPNLGLNLGLPAQTARAITPLSENRALIDVKTSTGFSGVFRISVPVDDIIRDFSIATPSGAHLIVAGMVRSMGGGCNCPANTLIRSLLRHLVLLPGQTVILDMEAGIEHLGRGTAEQVDVMLIVSDAGFSSLNVAAEVYRLASEAGIPHILIVGNRLNNAREVEIVKRFADSKRIPLLGSVPFCKEVEEADLAGTTPFADRSSPIVQSIRELFSAYVSKPTTGGLQ